MKAPTSAQPLTVNPFIRTEGHLMFTLCLAGVALEDLTSCDKLKAGDKGLHVNRMMMMQHVARDDSGLSLAKGKDAICFLRCIISVIPDAVIQATRRQRRIGGCRTESRASS